jgi:catechol 2,3-dioxygenase-like lactoylglutathione lyase family enzyme
MALPLFPHSFTKEHDMKPLGVDHITINCKDRDASFRFYEDFLSLKRLSTADLGDHVLYYYQLPGATTRLELIDYKEPQKNWVTGNTDTGIYRHFALTVDDLDAFYERCQKDGIKINLVPTHIPQIAKKVMLIADPNGVEIELIQA